MDVSLCVGLECLLRLLILNEFHLNELHLLEFPIVLGTGKRLFGPRTRTVPTAFEVTSTQTTSRGVVIRTLRPTGRPVLGSAPPPQ
jgi:hypothetical protein